MKKITFLIMIIINAFLISSCSKKEVIYNYQQLEGDYSQSICIGIDEKYSFNIEEIFKNTDIHIQQYQLVAERTHPTTVFIKKNTIIGRVVDKTTIYITLFEKNTSNAYRAELAKVWVVNDKTPKTIETVQDLVDIAKDLSGNYLLNNDIDLADYGEWNPIGTLQNPFRGAFINKKGYRILNLKIDKEDIPSEAGLFYAINGAFVDGIILENINITRTISKASGGISGFMYSGIIKNCLVSGTIVSQLYSGGIIGSYSGGYFENIEFNGEVTAQRITSNGDSIAAGGITGYSFSSFQEHFYKNCLVNGKINADTYAGGIIGLGYTPLSAINTIHDSRFEGNLEAPTTHQLIGNLGRYLESAN